MRIMCSKIGKSLSCIIANLYYLKHDANTRTCRKNYINCISSDCNQNALCSRKRKRIHGR
jgi:hypothetical protein